jgi:hypothetical protein
VQFGALQLAVQQQHQVPLHKIAKFIVDGENLSVSRIIPLFPAVFHLQFA